MLLYSQISSNKTSVQGTTCVRRIDYSAEWIEKLFVVFSFLLCSWSLESVVKNGVVTEHHAQYLFGCIFGFNQTLVLSIFPFLRSSSQKL